MSYLLYLVPINNSLCYWIIYSKKCKKLCLVCLVLPKF